MSEPSLASTTPGEQKAPPRRRRFRRLLRWAGAAFLLLLAVVAGALWWVSQVGLPPFAKRELIVQLRKAGWEVQFTRLRWGWKRGIVAENLQLSRTNAAVGPRILLASAECRLDPDAMKALRLRVQSVWLSGGQLILQLPGGRADEPLWMNGVEGEVRFRSTNLWELKNLRATVQGVDLELNGRLTNAALVRDWRVTSKPRQAGPPPGQHLAETLHKIRLTGVPRVSGFFFGDAHNFQRSRAWLDITVPAFVSPWGSGEDVALEARLVPASNPEAVTRIDMKFKAARGRTPWASSGEVQIHSVLEPTITRWLPTNSNTRITILQAETPWGKARRLDIIHTLVPSSTNANHSETELKISAERLEEKDARIDKALLALKLWHPATNWAPAVMRGKLELSHPNFGKTAGASMTEFAFSGSLPDRESLHLFRTNAGWEKRFSGIILSGEARIRDLEIARLRVPELMVGSEWTNNDWRVDATGLAGGGSLQAGAVFDTETRGLKFGISSSIDPLWLAGLLGTNAPQVFGGIKYQEAPRLEFAGSLILPRLTNEAPHWRAHLLPTFAGRGVLDVGECAYYEVLAKSLRIPIAISNLQARVTGFLLERPEGDLEGTGELDLDSGNFEARIHSHIDPTGAKPLAKTESVRKVFDAAQFGPPPDIRAEVRGQWGDWERLFATGSIAVTNAVIRGESVARVQSAFAYTNRTLWFLNPVAERPGERGTSPLIALDLREQKLYLTNVTGNLNPYVVTRIIGPKTAKAIAPYRFDVPPDVRLDGMVDLKKGSDNDHLIVDISGKSFHWEIFNADAISGRVILHRKLVRLTNIVATIYGGELVGFAQFDTTPKGRANFAFNMDCANIDFHRLMNDVSPKAKTNRLEGVLAGQLRVIYGDTGDLKSWQGEGNVQLHDGLIWDIPVFGLFSPVLNSFSPGLGNSRASDAKANFIITNSVVFTKDLEIHASAMRMQFEGTVDFTPEVDARVEAQLLRDLPGVGFFISKLFWPVTKIFEYRLTGPLGSPKLEPVYLIPKIISLPFQPFRALRNLVTPDQDTVGGLNEEPLPQDIFPPKK